jgi:hypothetical protein
MQRELVDVIRAARRGWRVRLTVRSLSVWLVAASAALALGAALIELARYAPAAVSVARLLAWGASAALLWWWVVRAVRRRVSDEQVALYVEEREPQLQGALLAAVQFSGTGDVVVSRALVDRLVKEAVARSEASDSWRASERSRLGRSAALAVAAAAVAAWTLVLRPGFLASALPFLLPTSAAASPYSIAVLPGDTIIARGADLEVAAVLRGFASERVELVVRRSGTESWDRHPMALDEVSARHGLVLFDIREDLEYLVEAAGVRSRVHTVRAMDLPWVAAIGVEYRFPPYTGLAPQREPGGDIVTLQGAAARVTLRPTIAVPGGALVAFGRDTIPLAPDTGGTLSGTIRVRQSGEYRVMLPGPGGRLLNGSPVYSIEAIEDQPPSVTFTRPGRDLAATPIDEVMVEARAADDFGVTRLELVYRVNGGEEQTLPLATGAPRREVVAGQVLMLEELSLTPGDVISYFARASDGRPGAEPQLSDIYFLSIRRFDRSFVEAEQQGMPGEGGMEAGQLTERQREVIAATFRVQRERSRTSEAGFRNDAAVVTLSQGALREDVETLARRIRERGVAARDTTMAAIAVQLDSAARAMREAEEQLGRRALEAALGPEQRALAHLSAAEAAFDREQQVSRGGQGSGGRGGASAQELADLFELELDRMQNQYESVQRDRREETAEQVDEALERLRELARRQQQEAERRSRAGGAAGTGGANQRRLAEEADSIARQLERLSREQRRPELGDAARQLRDAANQMRRSAADRDAGAAAGAAAERLRAAQRELERGRAAGLRRQVDDARDRAQRLADQQDQVEAEVARLDSDAPQQRADRLRRLGERKDLMAEELTALGEELERLAREAQRGQAEAAGRLREAARELREGRTADMIRYSRGTMANRSPEYARAFEEQIDRRLDSLASRLRSAAGAIGESNEERVQRALERTRDVAGALEGLGERMRETTGQSGGAEGGQPGQEGQRGQQGQRGEEGRQGQPGGQGGPGGGQLGADPQRQMQRQLQEQLRELRDVREQLRQSGVDTRELDAMIAGLGRAAGAAASGGVRRAVEDLSQTIVPGLREFEFSVRRQLGRAPELPRQAGEGRVPPAYRALVEEYYRSLAEGRP